MNDIEEVLFSRIIDSDQQTRKEMYQGSGSWSWFKIALFGFFFILVLCLLGI